MRKTVSFFSVFPPNQFVFLAYRPFSLPAGIFCGHHTEALFHLHPTNPIFEKDEHR